MDGDERQITNWLEAYTLRAEEFTKTEKRESKTPDFRVFKDTEFAFYCEVKTISSDKNQVGGLRNDPIYNRLTDDIHKAVQQFDAVNPVKEHLNVLAFVNHDGMCGFNDLLGVITGNFYAEGGGCDPIFRKYSHGRIINEKNRVHLYYWKDDFKPDRFFFTGLSDESVVEKLCQYFKMNSEEIKQI